jgi:hypothetical protein
MPDIILLDINLKGELDGIETARRVQQFADVPIIYLPPIQMKLPLTVLNLPGLMPLFPNPLNNLICNVPLNLPSAVWQRMRPV